MIYGIGIDLVSCHEFVKFLKDKSSKFLDSTFTALERKNCDKWNRSNRSNRQAQCYSGRYAAKEAVIKAIDGERLFQKPNLQFQYTECEVRNDGKGRPFLYVHGSLYEYFIKHGIKKTHLSISHIQDYAIAQVILETQMASKI